MDKLRFAVEAFILGTMCTSTTTSSGDICTDLIGNRGHCCNQCGVCCSKRGVELDQLGEDRFFGGRSGSERIKVFIKGVRGDDRYALGCAGGGA